MVPFTSRGGLQLLEHVLELNPRQVTVVSVDWNRFSERFRVHSQAPFLSEVIRAGQRTPERNALQDRLKDAPAGQRHALVLAYLCEEAAHVLGFASPASLDPKRPLNELGLDSLMAVELRNTLGMALGQNLPATLLFNYPSLEALAGYLSRDVLGLEPQPEAGPEPSAEEDEREASVTMLEQLSDEEVEALLTRKLDVLDEQKVR
jgi:acyl carrier protein